MSGPATRRRAVAATAVGVALVALTSALQSVIFLGRFGTTGRTDGVLAAYSLYVLVSVFAQGARISGAAALGGSRPRVQAVDFAWALVVLAVAVAALAAVGRDVLATVVTGGGAQDAAARDGARAALPILGAAAALQYVALIWATLLGRRGQLEWVAGALAVGGVLGLGVFLAVLGPADELALAWGALATAAASCVGLAVKAPPRWARPRGRPLLGALGLLARENLLPSLSTAVYVIALAVAARVTTEDGQLTLFSLAFLACSYLCGISSTSVAIVDVSAETTRADLGDQLADAVPRGVAFAVRLALPALAVGVLLCGPVLAALAPADLRRADPDVMALSLLLLTPFTLATITSNVAGACWYVCGRVREANRLLPATLGLHVVACLLGAVALGVAGVAGASGVAPVLFAAALLRPSPPTARRVGAGILRTLGWTVVCWGLPAAVVLPAADGSAARVAVAAVGAVAYAALTLGPRRLRPQGLQPVA